MSMRKMMLRGFQVLIIIIIIMFNENSVL